MGGGGRPPRPGLFARARLGSPAPLSGGPRENRPRAAIPRLLPRPSGPEDDETDRDRRRSRDRQPAATRARARAFGPRAAPTRRRLPPPPHDSRPALPGRAPATLMPRRGYQSESRS